MKPMRYAHSEGHTDCCYEESGRYILTCGTDGDVRIWKGIDDDDAVSHRVGDRAYSIAFKNGRFFIANDAYTVQACKFPDGMPDGILTRFTAAVNHIVFNSLGDTMVAAASDFTVRVVEVESSRHKVYRGHKAPVLSVALDPKEEFVASSSCDGTVQLWKFTDQSEVKVLNLLQKCSDVSLAKSLCRLCWTQEGEFLLVPVGKEIHLYARNTWDIQKLALPVITETISVMALSPDGKHVAAACFDGVICIFNWKTKQLVEKHRHEKGVTVCALAWNPSDIHQIAFCDKEGQLGVLENVLDSIQDQSGMSSTVMEGVFDDDDDMLIQASGKTMHDNALDYDDDDSIDIGAIKKQMMPAILGEDDSNAADSMTGDKDEEIAPSRPLSYLLEGFKPTPMQKSFQPGSTPEHLSSRFMKWNSIGIIRQYNTEEENSIDIEFHDTAVHHAMHVTNTSDFTMADLSTEAVVLASPSNEESKSMLTCMHFGSWDNTKEWSVTMPDGEIIEAVVLGDGWLALATSARNVRLFTVGGVQQHTFTLPGPVVCLAAHGQRLLAVFHAGMGIPGDQNMACRIIRIRQSKASTTDNTTHLPLSPKATLSWMGFSAEGTPFYMDSEGIVRMMNTALENTWTQVANTRENIKGKSDHYWIVGVNENPQQLRCIPCKGSHHPATLPRPAVAILPFQLPLCEITTEKSQYEEAYLRSMLFAQHLLRLADRVYEVDETTQQDLHRPAQEALMKLFALSARSEREFRAIEVCELMPDEHTLQLSIKYASRLKHMQLAQKISELAHRRAQETNAEEDVEEKEDFREYLQASHNNSETEWSTKSSLRTRAESENEDEDAEKEEDDLDKASENIPSGPMLTLKPKDKNVSKTFTRVNNPFKVSSQQKESPLPTKGTQIFDSMKKIKERTTIISPLPISIKQTKSGQRKITVKTSQQCKSSQQKKISFSNSSEKSSNTAQPNSHEEEESSENEPKNQPVSAFELWLAENQQDLVKEHPELSTEDMNIIAAQTFRALPDDERQKWIQKATFLNQPEGNLDKKRKYEAKYPDSKDEDTPLKLQKTDLKDLPAKKPLSQSINSKLANFAFPSQS